MKTTLKLGRFLRKGRREQWAAIKATFGVSEFAREQRRIDRYVNGRLAPPEVTKSRDKFYVAFRPDSDAVFAQHSELASLSEKWVRGNVKVNGGDLPRLYALLFNTKQILAEKIPGDIAELGVFRGNSAAVFAHCARLHDRKLWLFDTFEGFDKRDLVGLDNAKTLEFADTSVERVTDLVGEENVRIVKGRFPQSTLVSPPDCRFCLVHIDCDLYEPAKAGLEFFYPRLSPGGLIIIHDYANPFWPGIKEALDSFCRNVPERMVVLGDKSGTAMIRKSISI
jgi:hypothetical protein